MRDLMILLPVWSLTAAVCEACGSVEYMSQDEDAVQKKNTENTKTIDFWRSRKRLHDSETKTAQIGSAN